MEVANIEEILMAHLGACPPECRWCFAIDMTRIAGEEIDYYVSPDMTMIRLKCPRCGGEYTFISEGFEEQYLVERIAVLYPDLSVEKAFLLKSVQDDLKFRDAVKKGEIKPYPECASEGFQIMDIREIDDEAEGGILNRLFPEEQDGNWSKRHILDLMFPERFVGGKPRPEATGT